MQKYEVEGHVPSYLPEGPAWKMVWNDEFDGPELDETKWGFRLDFWGKRYRAFTTEGIKFDGNSNIELHRVEKDGRYVSPHLQTGSICFDAIMPDRDGEWGKMDIWPLGKMEEPKFMHRFGYYECRCKFQKDPETMWSAFWMQSPSVGTAYDPCWAGVEVDIMEHFHAGEITAGNYSYGAQAESLGRVFHKVKETEDGFHTFGLHWTPDKYTIYCDGEVIDEITKYVSQVPEFILLTTEVQGYRMGWPVDRTKVEGEFVDDAFIVDYVRVFDEV